MTAEIAILNRWGVALAADSAVTTGGVSGQKIFQSANKLFYLSKHNSVGLMVFGSASFMDIPWETIVGMFRERIGAKEFATIDNVVSDFIEHLKGFSSFISPRAEEIVFVREAGAWLKYLSDSFRNDWKSFIEKKKKATQKDVTSIISNRISLVEKMLGDGKAISDIPEGFDKSLVSKYNKVIDELIKRCFEELPISTGDINRMKMTLAHLCYKFPKGVDSASQSGVVVAGFGKDEIFPVVKSLDVAFMVNGVLKYKVASEKRVTESLSSSIIPFAQKDVVANFMNGIHPDRSRIEDGLIAQLFKDFIESSVEKIEGLEREQKDALRKNCTIVGIEKLKEYSKKINSVQKLKFNQPVMNVISVLPKEELAMVAETLVDLTSFKRRVTMQSETVGGPVDVAVISKVDGFVWIKRKQYFNNELNTQINI